MHICVEMYTCLNFFVLKHAKKIQDYLIASI